MKKGTILIKIISIICISLILPACSLIKPDKEMRPTERYLYAKYDNLFTFDHYGPNDKENTYYIFSDEKNNQFTLVYNNYYFADNYQSCLYKQDIEKHIKANISDTSKIEVNTANSYTTSNFKVNDFKAYLLNGINLTCNIEYDIQHFNKDTFQKQSINVFKELKCQTTTTVTVKDKSKSEKIVLFTGLLHITKNCTTEGWLWTDKNTKELPDKESVKK